MNKILQKLFIICFPLVTFALDRTNENSLFVDTTKVETVVQDSILCNTLQKDNVIDDSTYISLDSIDTSNRKIPLLRIYTENRVMPDFEKIYAPEGYWGISIINNDYVYGTLELNGMEDSLSIDSIKIRVRGNTSAIYYYPCHLKLKLPQKYDLIGKGEENKDWYLINLVHGIPQIYPIGSLVAKKAGIKWQPEYKYVEMYLNDTYCGIYMIVDAIEKADKRINVKKDGFIIEADAYWWKPNTKYFKTTNQIPQLAYTFKYPDDDDLTQDKVDSISIYMEYIENLLHSNSENLSEIIDFNTFAGWLLTHDLMGIADAAGSNMFLHKKSLASNSKLKIGPCWDFDSSFKNEEPFSYHHTHDLVYMPLLLRNEKFVEVYKNKWEELKNDIYYEVSTKLDSMVESLCIEMDSLIEVNNKNTGLTIYEFEDSANRIKNWFNTRIEKIDSHIDEIKANSKIELVKSDIYKESYTEYYNLMGQRVIPNIKGLYIKKTPFGISRIYIK